MNPTAQDWLRHLNYPVHRSCPLEMRTGSIMDALWDMKVQEWINIRRNDWCGRGD